MAMQEPGVTRDGNSEDARNRCGRSKDGQRDPPSAYTRKRQWSTVKEEDEFEEVKEEPLTATPEDLPPERESTVDRDDLDARLKLNLFSGGADRPNATDLGEDLLDICRQFARENGHRDRILWVTNEDIDDHHEAQQKGVRVDVRIRGVVQTTYTKTASWMQQEGFVKTTYAMDRNRSDRTWVKVEENVGIQTSARLPSKWTDLIVFSHKAAADSSDRRAYMVRRRDPPTPPKRTHLVDVREGLIVTPSPKKPRFWAAKSLSKTQEPNFGVRSKTSEGRARFGPWC